MAFGISLTWRFFCGLEQSYPVIVVVNPLISSPLPFFLIFLFYMSHLEDDDDALQPSDNWFRAKVPPKNLGLIWYRTSRSFSFFL